MSRPITTSIPRRGNTLTVVSSSVLRAEASTTVTDAVLGVERSLTGRAWYWRMPAGADIAAIERLGLAISQRHGVSDLLGRLIATRGIGIDQADTFLQPTLRALMPDPSVLAGMDQAAARIAAAITARETIAIFGDYDVDGACGTTLMLTVLRACGCPVLYHIPDRLREGYGPNAPALLSLAERGASLIICVDCGTAAQTALSAVSGRADILVLDHHKSDTLPPAALATVNPNGPDDRSGLTMLCATGVALLTCVATFRQLRRNGWQGHEGPPPDLLEMLDLVALATVCDVMPLTGINRAFVTQGLKVMDRRNRIGIAALLEVAQMTGRVTASTCGFVLGPRINAAGRIDSADMGVRLLTATDPIAARDIAQALDSVNGRRQTVESSILDAAVRDAEARIEAGDAAIVIGGEDWHPGVVGIIAGRLRERFNRPACVAGSADGLLKGSGRSVPGIDLGAAIIAAHQHGLLRSGGGHAMAAGFALPPESLPAFRTFMNERLAAAALLPKAADLALDASLGAGAVTVAMAEELAQLAPFGNGNDEPLLVLPRLRCRRAERIGRDGGTIRAFLESESGHTIKALLFRAKPEDMAAPIADILLNRELRPLHLAGYLRAETWNGTTSANFCISDAALA
ncbi:single-stranded-DNA-specific exonuclease RecJ [Granulibacter bethesdensis]|uniref:single-stranded-DNA-specific exonuclease RecJ n=1 Tax=Granulibacter bethesdensis TaxID=364410 RepID=UPI0003F1FEFA|nr:single-stranded-DNA-specific exonuclease RecJ [Granulibacter bethesdensis]AHJ66139.1 Single-stranded-DNA-specific exonuclease recJ [Granulibacter bethesdensis CGDNIH4]